MQVCVCAFICAHASIWHCTFVCECVCVCVCVHLALISNHSLYLVLHHLLKNPALFLSSALLLKLRADSNGIFYMCSPFLSIKLVIIKMLVFGLLQANTNTTLWQHKVDIEFMWVRIILSTVISRCQPPASDIPSRSSCSGEHDGGR